LISGWKLLQLPNKRDQERTLHLINELHHRVAELEAKLDQAREGQEAAQETTAEVRVARKKKTSNGSELVSLQ
jgi:outer membrane murein-binding lipoprotein Lpp